MRLKQFAKPKWVGVSSHSQLSAASPRRARVGLSLLWRCCSSPKRVFFSGLLLLAALYSAVVAPIADAATTASYQGVVLPYADTPDFEGADGLIGQTSNAQSVTLPSGTAASYQVAENSSFSLTIGFRMTAISPEPTTMTGEIRSLTFELVYSSDSRFVFEGHEILDSAAVNTGDSWEDYSDLTVSEETGNGGSTSGITISAAVTGSDETSILCGKFCLWPALVRLNFSVGALDSASEELDFDLQSRVLSVVHTYGDSPEISYLSSTAALVVTRPTVLRLRDLSDPLLVSAEEFVRVEAALDSDGDALYGAPSIGDFTVSLTATSTVSLAPSTASGDSFSLEVLTATDGEQALLTFTDNDRALSATATVTLDVVATALTVSAPSTVTSGVIFALTVTGMDSNSNEDTAYSRSAATTVTASAGTLVVESSTASSIDLRLSEVTDGDTVTLTVTDGSVSGTADVAVNVVATALTVSASPDPVVSGQSFTLTVTGVDADGATDTGYSRSAATTVTASVGTLVEESSTATSIDLRLSEVADGADVTLTVTDGSVSGTAAVTVNVVATALTVSASPDPVVSGQSFTLTVTGVDADGATDTGYSRSAATTVTASVGTLVEESSTATSIDLRLSEVADGADVTLTVTDGSVSGTAAVTVNVVATALTVSASPDPVVSGQSFTLTVTGVDADGATDTGYSRSAATTVTASVGTLVEESSTATSIDLRLSEVADGADVTLTVTDGSVSGTAAVTVNVVATALTVSASPDPVVSGQSFTLTVTGVDADGATDTGYSRSAATTVTASVGTLVEESSTATSIDLRLSEVADGADVTLTDGSEL